MDYLLFYDFVSEEKTRLEAMGAEIVSDYRLCKALAACYELQDHLANIYAGMVERGEVNDPEQMDGEAVY